MITTTTTIGITVMGQSEILVPLKSFWLASWAVPSE